MSSNQPAAPASAPGSADADVKTVVAIADGALTDFAAVKTTKQGEHEQFNVGGWSCELTRRTGASKVACKPSSPLASSELFVEHLGIALGKKWTSSRTAGAVQTLKRLNVEWTHADGRNISLTGYNGKIHELLVVSTTRPAPGTRSDEVTLALAYADAARTGFSSIPVKPRGANIATYEITDRRGCSLEGGHNSSVIRCWIGGWKRRSREIADELAKALGKQWKPIGKLDDTAAQSVIGWRHEDGRAIYLEAQHRDASSLAVLSSQGLTSPEPSPSNQLETIQFCLLEKVNARLNSRRQPWLLVSKQVQYDKVTGQVSLGGKPLSEVHSLAPYARTRPWLLEGRPILQNAYVKYGLARVLRVNELVPLGEHEGVAVFGEAGGPISTAEYVYVPVAPNCVFQPYKRE